jgi:hypothetical protein
MDDGGDMDRQSIREEIRRLVRDVDTINPRWSDTVLNSRIDQAHEYIACETRCIWTRATDIDLVAGTQEYALPSNFLEETEVLYKNSSDEWSMLEKKQIRELDLEGWNWRALTGDPSMYYIRGAYIGLVPYPDTSRTGALRIDLAIRPTAFTSETDIPFDSNNEFYAYHDALCFYVALKCKLDENQDKDANAMNIILTQRVAQIQKQVESKSVGTRIMNVYEIGRAKSRRAR